MLSIVVVKKKKKSDSGAWGRDRLLIPFPAALAALRTVLLCRNSAWALIYCVVIWFNTQFVDMRHVSTWQE